MRLVNKIRKAARQVSVNGTVVETFTNSVVVRLVSGQLLRNISYIGNQPAQGDSVVVTWIDGIPTVQSKSSSGVISVSESTTPSVGGSEPRSSDDPIVVDSMIEGGWTVDVLADGGLIHQDGTNIYPAGKISLDNVINLDSRYSGYRMWLGSSPLSSPYSVSDAGFVYTDQSRSKYFAAGNDLYTTSDTSPFGVQHMPTSLSDSIIGMRNILTFSNGSSGYGLLTQMGLNYASGHPTGWFNGLASFITNYLAGNYYGIIGVESNIQNGSGTVSLAYNFIAQCSSNTNGTITSRWGLKIVDSASVLNHYGIQIDTLTGKNYAYAIYTGDNPSRFGGQITIESTVVSTPDLLITSPAGKLVPSLSITNLYGPQISLNSSSTIQSLSNNLYISTSGDIVSSSSFKPSHDMVSDLGSDLKRWKSLYAAEMIVETIVAQSVMATIGGKILVSPTSYLVNPISKTDEMITLKHNAFSANDYLYMEGGGEFEAMQVISYIGETSEGHVYNVKRGLENSPSVRSYSLNIQSGYYGRKGMTRRMIAGTESITYGVSWPAGSAVVSFQYAAGTGYIELTSTTTALGGYTGPLIEMRTRTATTNWNDLVPTLALGNLKGYLDYASNTMGLAIGDNLISLSSTFKGITIDRTNGVRLYNTVLRTYNSTLNTGLLDYDGDMFLGSNISAAATTSFIHLASSQTYNGEASLPAGTILLGDNTTNKANLIWDSTNGLRLRSGTTDKIKLDASGNATITGVLGIGSAGGIYQGTGTFASPTTGLKIYSIFDSPDYFGTIAGYNGGVEQWSIGSDGYIYAGSIMIYKDTLSVPGCVNLTTNGDVNVSNNTYVMWDSSTANSIINSKAASNEYSMTVLCSGSVVSNLTLKSDGGTNKVSSLKLDSFAASTLTLPSSYNTFYVYGYVSSGEPFKRDATEGYIYVPIASCVLQDTGANNWNGSLSRNTGTYVFDMQASANGSIPSDAKAVYIRIAGVQTASSSNYIAARAYNSGETNFPVGHVSLDSSIGTGSSGICPLDNTNHDIEIVVGGANATSCYAIVCGYFI